jgi:hypothetical protein
MPDSRAVSLQQSVNDSLASYEMELINWFRGGKVHRARESFDLAALMDQPGVTRAKH